MSSSVKNCLKQKQESKDLKNYLTRQQAPMRRKRSITMLVAASETTASAAMPAFSPALLRRP